MRLPARDRSGMSLLEVLAALAIFLFALVAIGRLITLSSDRALDVQQQSQAVQLCQSKVNEVLAGVVPVSSSQSETPFDEDPNWNWSMDSQAGAVAGLWNVTVRVSRQRPDGSRLEVSLSRMVLDPSLRGSAGTSSAAPASSASSSAATPSAGSTSSGMGASANAPAGASGRPASSPATGGTKAGGNTGGL